MHCRDARHDEYRDLSGYPPPPAALTPDAAIHQALQKHKDGETTVAISLLEDYLKTASAEESVAPMLRLAYLYHAAGDRDEAGRRFKRLANLPEGVNDAVRGEAALRAAYSSTGRERAVWAERIVAGQFEVDEQTKIEAYRMAAGGAQKRGDLRRAVEAYQESPEMQLPGGKRSYVFKELAGLYFELGKGEGDVPVAEEARHSMYSTSREISQALMNMDDAPDDHRMVAELMHAETFLFESKFQLSYDNAAAFLERWGSDPSRYEATNMRVYINTAKTLQMQNAWIVGKNAEAEALATEMVNNPPKKDEEFTNSDSMLIGLEILKLCAHDRGDQEAVAHYGARAWQHRSDYLGTERNLQRRRTEFLNQSGNPQ